MKNLFIILSILICSCNTGPIPVYQVPPVVVQQQPQPYQIMMDAGGNQVVYYTDPTSHLSYYLEYALFMSMWNSPNRYYSINHYYISHRSYIDSRSSYYSRSYTRRSSPSGYSNRPASPAGTRPSSPTGMSNSSNRPASPRSSTTYTSRPSSPSSSSSMRSSSPTRSSSPGSRRH